MCFGKIFQIPCVFPDREFFVAIFFPCGEGTLREQGLMVGKGEGGCLVR